MSNPAATIAYAKSQVGYHEGRDRDGDWNNHEKYAAMVPGLAWVSTGEQPWCATFVAACAFKGGVAQLYPVTASTDAGAAWFRSRGEFSEYPSVGAQVFYGHGGDMVHTGLVIDFGADTITTIEGNTNTNGSPEGDGVYRKVHQRRDDFVQGYGHPAFTEAVRSADPAYRAPKPAANPHPAHDPTRVQQAHDLLDKAEDVARNHGNDHRADRIHDADQQLPRR